MSVFELADWMAHDAVAVDTGKTYRAKVKYYVVFTAVGNATLWFKYWDSILGSDTNLDSVALTGTGSEVVLDGSFDVVFTPAFTPIRLGVRISGDIDATAFVLLLLRRDGVW